MDNKNELGLYRINPKYYLSEKYIAILSDATLRYIADNAIIFPLIVSSSFLNKVVLIAWRSYL